MNTRPKAIVYVCAVLVYIGGFVGAGLVMERFENPLLALPFVCVAFAAIGFFLRLHLPRRHREFMERVGFEEGEALMWSMTFTYAATMAVTAIGVWSVLTNATAWISRLILAYGAPAGSLYYVRYPGVSMWLLCVGGIAAGILVGNFLTLRLGRRYGEAWEEYRHMFPGVVSAKWVIVLSTGLLIVSILFAAMLLPVGAVVNDRGISVREFGQVRMSFHPWSAMRELRSYEGRYDTYEAVFSDGYRWRLSEDTSTFDRFSSDFSQVAVAMLKHVEGGAKFTHVKGP